jgi:NTE family protein
MTAPYFAPATAHEPVVALVLGGGSARGLAHLGVMAVLEREQIGIHQIVGTSMGAILGAAWLAGGKAEKLRRKLRAFFRSSRFLGERFALLRTERWDEARWRGRIKFIWQVARYYLTTARQIGFVSAEQFRDNITIIVPDIAIGDLPIPYCAVAADLHSGDEVLLTSGSLRSAVFASAAIPGLVPPVGHGEQLLIDGGWIDKLPVEPAYHLGADVVIAVDVSNELADFPRMRRGIDVARRGNAILAAAARRREGRLADVLIAPELPSLHWTEFERIDELVACGKEAAERSLPAIRAAIELARATPRAAHTGGKTLALRPRENRYIVV